MSPTHEFLSPKMASLFFDIGKDGGAEYAPSDFKIAYGGRGSGKSEGFVGMGVVLADATPQRILCFRETQASIAESMHALIEHKISELGLARNFTVLKNEIIGKRHSSQFIFAGLRTDPNKIKSIHGLTIAIGDEMESLSKVSWEKFKPSVRGTGAEIWGSFNPESADAPVYRDFVAGPILPSSRVVEVNWRDNPWFPENLNRQRLHMQATDPDAYEHVWEGGLKISSQMQILNGKWRVEGFEVPADAMGPYFGADWGFSQDPTALIKTWITPDNDLLVEHEAYGIGVDIDELPRLFDEIPESRDYTILADSARPETISHMQRNGFLIEPAEKWAGSVEDGIQFMRGFRSIVIHPRCSSTISEAKYYRYKADPVTGLPTRKIIDSNNHCIDAIRYALNPFILNSDAVARFRALA